MRISLTGIKSSGTPHIGNYLGMIRPALRLAEDYQALYFIADAHALTTERDGAALRRQTNELVATWIALGLDTSRSIIWKQTDVLEVFELAWILSCVTPKGLLNRAHAYKDIVDDNVASGRTPDDGVNMGLFNYPVLMAADILLFGGHVVPVGQDQQQHIEMTRDIAQWFNNAYGEILTVPEGHILEEVATITGLDGRKMSKRYDNVIPIMSPADESRRLVMRIVTDSRRPEEPKDPESDNLYSIYRHFAPPVRAEEVAARYRSGGIGYGEVKKELAGLIESTFRDARERYEALLADPAAIDAELERGAGRARELAMPIIAAVRDAVGFSR